MFLQNTVSFFFFALAAAHPLFTPRRLELGQRGGNFDHAGADAGGDTYTLYRGDGSVAAGWPSMDQWVDYTDMFNNNKQSMFTSCDQYNVPDDSGPEVGAIWNAIQQVSQSANVDKRFILAIIMQESGGCVRVPTSNYGVRNPGLMQSHDGDGTCNSDITHIVSTPCPDSEITQMVTDGAAGTSSGDGLATILNRSDIGRSNAQAYYKAARIYNSGSIDPSGNLEAGIATHCYSSDVANRLTGWVNAPHGCNLDG